VKDTLYLDAYDISEEAAMRLGTSVLSASLLRFYNELSFARKTIEWLALIFGTLMFIPVLLAGMGSDVLMIVIMVITSLVFSKMVLIGRRQNEEVRRNLPVILEKTRVLNDYEVKYYSKRIFPRTSKSEWKIVIGYHLLLIGMGCLGLLLL
jgi:hypothetical protein